MPTSPDEIDVIVQSLLAEEEERPAPTEAAIQAALADPTFAGIVARSMERFEPLLTDKAKDHARRTLAVVFLTDPGAVALLAEVREDERKLGSTAVTVEKSGVPAAVPRKRGWRKP